MLMQLILYITRQEKSLKVTLSKGSRRIKVMQQEKVVRSSSEWIKCCSL